MAFTRIDNSFVGGATVTGVGNTAERIPVSQFLSETGESIPENIGTHVLKCTVAQTANILFTLPSYSPDLDFTDGSWSNIVFRYYVAQSHLDNLTDVTMEMRLENVSAANRRNLEDQRKSLGRTTAGYNSLVVPLMVLEDAAPDADITVFDADSGTYDPSAVDHFAYRLFGDTGAPATPVIFYLLDIVRDDVISIPPIIWMWDDGDDTQYTDMFDIAQPRAIKGTMFVIGTSIDTSGSMTAAQIQEMNATRKFETALHGLNKDNHLSSEGYNDLTKAEVETDIQEQIAAMHSKGVVTQHALKMLAYPLGQHFETTDFFPINPIVEGEGVIIGRSTDDNFPAPSFTNPLGMRSISLGQGAGFITTIAEFNTQVDDAMDAGLPILVLGHKIVTSSPTGNNILKSELQSMFDSTQTRVLAGTSSQSLLSEYLTSINFPGFTSTLTTPLTRSLTSSLTSNITG